MNPDECRILSKDRGNSIYCKLNMHLLFYCDVYRNYTAGFYGLLAENELTTDNI